MQISLDPDSGSGFRLYFISWDKIAFQRDSFVTVGARVSVLGNEFCGRDDCPGAHQRFPGNISAAELSGDRSCRSSLDDQPRRGIDFIKWSIHGSVIDPRRAKRNYNCNKHMG